MRIFVCFALAILAWGTLSISAGAQTKKQPAEFPDQVELEKMAARFAPTPLRVEILGLSSGDRQALVKLIQAARVLDDVVAGFRVADALSLGIERLPAR